ncbi:hypothetical protein PSAB6_460007 [Paraburkholderia sabiae]|nr:hypothetical protein PSAB6_460007 [Paraburkholderia sabiae]
MTRRKRKVEEPTADAVREHSPGNLRPELLAFAQGRTTEVKRKLDKAMKDIELDIEANERIYPYNGGRVTQAEVCRRAGIRKATLQGDAHKLTTKLVVNEFVARIRTLAIKGARSVRRNVTDRANYWKDAHRQIADAYRIDALRYEAGLTELEKLKAESRPLQQQNAELQDQNAELLKQNADLRTQTARLTEHNAQLREQVGRLSGSNVVLLPPRVP